MRGRPFWRRRREAFARKRRRWDEYPEDRGNAERKERAEAEMRAFEKLGPQARAAIRESRFDAVASYVWRCFGGPYADDGAVANRVRKDDDSYSGRFGPRFSRGI